MENISDYYEPSSDEPACGVCGCRDGSIGSYWNGKSSKDEYLAELCEDCAIAWITRGV
jgi:hypothetical protein